MSTLKNKFILYFSLKKILSLEENLFPEEIHPIFYRGKKIIQSDSSKAIHVHVLPEISDAPSVTRGKLTFPLPERVIVDMLVYPNAFGLKNSTQVYEIFNSMKHHHTFNQPMMFRYASRRNKKEALISMLKSKKSK